MPNYTVGVAAATAVLDYDMFIGQVWSRQPQDRVITGLACCGSAVTGDAEVEVYVDEVRIGNFFNTKLLLPNNDELMPLESLGIPGGAQLRGLVRDAPATSILYVMAALEDL